MEQIAGHERQVRSSHLFEPRAEVVLEEYAPPQLFAGVEHAVFLAADALAARDQGLDQP